MKFDNNLPLRKRDKKIGLRLPTEMSSELAELIGIHFGDGNMQNKCNFTHRILYSCNIAEKQYADYIVNLFRGLFSVDLKSLIIHNKSYIMLYIYSKTLCEFFNNHLEIPYSPKCDLQIPSCVLRNKRYLSSFIRVVFDTDGCITFQRDRKYIYPLVKITSGNRNFAESIVSALDILSIHAFISTKSNNLYSGYDVVVRNKNAKLFFDKIGSNNMKNIKIWGCWDSNFCAKS